MAHHSYLNAYQGARPPPLDSERALRTVHVGGIGGLGETITENDVADFFGQQGASSTGSPRVCVDRSGLSSLIRRGHSRAHQRSLLLG
jgi:hypothetical protein